MVVGRNCPSICTKITNSAVLQVEHTSYHVTGVVFSAYHPIVPVMASRRSLGGGRILGSGRNLTPPAPPNQSTKPGHVRTPSNLSYSENSVSLSSHTSSTPVSNEDEDLASRIALGEHASTAQAAAAASSRMVCPICNEEMVRRFAHV
jgi:hypothetical protein